MEDKELHLQTLTDIKNLMQKSSRFISLSGFSGISAGIIALIGAGFAYWKNNQLGNSFFESSEVEYEFIIFCFVDAILMLFTAINLSIFFTVRKSKNSGQSIWDKSAINLILSLLVPLFSGGMFCIALFYYQLYLLIAPAMLVFYGLSLLNASRYTIHSIHLLAYGELMLGIISLFYVKYGFIFWVMGFGFLHILYGFFMYYKYERNMVKEKF